ncbi:hypothetical protein O3M35_011522 [Rhynocoris fuscipes]|uniref:Uncharacterized protein n=1 Tax=Rhynocoris fuscipes TaxID=488301 RepID=A0AAW1CVF6_9HEMI
MFYGKLLEVIISIYMICLGGNGAATMDNVILPTGTCNSTEPVFHCTSNTCVPAKLLCNGIPDCDNGIDESVQQCGKSHFIYLLI